eukprot:scaffold263_cov159-Amphora_coffeaeformis.AAC.2
MATRDSKIPYFAVCLLLLTPLEISVKLCDGRLVFRSFSSFRSTKANSLASSLLCADGSTTGIYTEDWQGQDDGGDEGARKRDPLRHVIAIVGGGACTNLQDCQATYSRTPFVFTSRYNPSFVDGDTIFSNDPSENPTLHNYTKTLIPYCSQDFFLGKGVIDKNYSLFGNATQTTHNGSALFRASIIAWLEMALEWASSFEDVVIVGISAGTIPLMNRLDFLRQTIGQRTKHIGFILDSPGVLSDRPLSGIVNLTDMPLHYFDLEANPYCDPYHPLSRLYQLSELSILPCCLSIHCMLRHHPSFEPFFMDSIGNYTEEMLILDSAYDFLELAAGPSVELDGYVHFRADSRQLLQDSAFIFETGGNRKARSRETAAFVTAKRNNAYVTPIKGATRLQWLFSSCFAHSFILPAKEFNWRACQYGRFDEEPFHPVCKENGYGWRFRIPRIDQHIIFWKTSETWRQVEFEQQTLRQIIGKFVTPHNSGMEVPSTGFANQGAIDVRHDCVGVNCLALCDPDTDRPSCQALVQVESEFKYAPWWLQVLPLIVAPLLLFTLLERHNGRKRIDAMHAHINDTSENSDDNSRVEEVLQADDAIDLHLRGISVSVVNGENRATRIVDDVALDLPSGTITAKGAKDLSCMKKAYLRQADTLYWGNTRPADLLLANSMIYEASPKKTNELYNLLLDLFKRNDFDTSTNPFLSTPIDALSGGQRRLMNIASALLGDASLLLLDEPMSGLDSVSSMRLVEALSSIATAQSVTMPSPELMEKFDNFVVMNSGKIVFQGPVRSTEEIIRGQQDGDLLQYFLRGELQASMFIRRMQSGDSSRDPISGSFVDTEHAPDMLRSGRKAKTSIDQLSGAILRQALALLHRLQIENGWMFYEPMLITAAYVVVALMLLLENSQSVRIIYMVLTMVSLPPLLFLAKNVQSGQLWLAHRLELDDRIVKPASFDHAYDNDEVCNDLLTCIASDGGFVAHYLGYAQMTTAYLSLGVLTLVFYGGVVLELVAVRYKQR